MQKIAIVILNYNGSHLLSRFLPDVLAYSPEGSVYVADNGSSDDSLILLKTSFPDVNIIELKQNFGYCQGYNIALRNIKSEYYVLLNSDVGVTAHWYEPVISLMDSDPDIAACQPKILDFYNNNKFEYAGAAGGFIDKWGYPFCRGRVFNTTEPDHGQFSTGEVFWASGACMFVRSTVFHQLNGLDKDFFAHMEEIDLCWRMKSLGHKVFYCAESVIYHVGGGTLQKSNPRKTYFNFRNGLFMLMKNLPRRQLFYVLPVRYVLDLLTVFKFLFSGNAKDSLAILKAHVQFFFNIRLLIIKRNNTIRSENFKKMKGVYNSSLFIDYFLLNKTKFEQLDESKIVNS